MLQHSKVQTNQSTLTTMFVVILLATLMASLETASSRPLQPKTTPHRSVYDVLRAHGLPMGLLPKGVRNFTLDDDGRFEAYLEQACNAKFESELHYDLEVNGWLSYGQIGNLTGVSAQELFLWFPVREIRVDVPSSGLIYFDVGVVFKQFSLSLFESPRDCLASALPKVKGGELSYRFDEEESGRGSM